MFRVILLHSLSNSPDRAMVRTARQSRSGCSETLRRNTWSRSRLCAVFSPKRPLDGPLSDASLSKACFPRAPARSAIANVRILVECLP